MNEEFGGYHKFKNEEGEEYGSFEVFYIQEGHKTLTPGWYWWASFPGCLADGDPMGPFPTDEGAYLDALED